MMIVSGVSEIVVGHTSQLSGSVWGTGGVV